jgi:hypothetical protein
MPILVRVAQVELILIATFHYQWEWREKVDRTGYRHYVVDGMTVVDFIDYLPPSVMEEELSTVRDAPYLYCETKPPYPDHVVPVLGLEKRTRKYKIQAWEVTPDFIADTYPESTTPVLLEFEKKLSVG